MTLQRSYSIPIEVETRPLVQPSTPPVYVNREYTLPLRSTSADQNPNTAQPPSYECAHSAVEAQLQTKLLKRNLFRTEKIWKTLDTHIKELNVISAFVTVNFSLMVLIILFCIAILVILVFHAFFRT